MRSLGRGGGKPANAMVTVRSVGFHYMGHFGGWPRAWLRQTRERDEPHDVKTAHGYSRAREAMAFVAFHLSDVMIGGRSGIDRFVRISAGAAANVAGPGE